MRDELLNAVERRLYDLWVGVLQRKLERGPVLVSIDGSRRGKRCGRRRLDLRLWRALGRLTSKRRRLAYDDGRGWRSYRRL